MTEVVSVRFKNKGKVYFFSPAGLTVSPGDPVIVETAKGLEYAECVKGNHEVDDANVIPPLRPVIRIATEEDTQKAEENSKKEAEAFEICKEKILKHELDMKLVDVEYNFEGNKILFFFTSDGRVDFRDLVKDLASVFKTRIELRQIGVRDEARMLGGLGICGRPFCCAQFLDDFQPVSIKMAKTQGLSLNPTKISGTCGRLMCCLKYEQGAYEDLVKNVPKVDAFVETPEGKGSVTDVNLLRSRVRVRLEEHGETSIKTFDAADIEVLGGKAMRAEFLAAKAEEQSAKEPQKPENNKPEKTRYIPESPAVYEEDAPEPYNEVEPENLFFAEEEPETLANIVVESSEPAEEKAPAKKNSNSGYRKKHFSKHRRNGGSNKTDAKPSKEQPKERTAAVKIKHEPSEPEKGEKDVKKAQNNKRRYYRGKKRPGNKPDKSKSNPE